MTLANKRCVALAGLVILALWPLVHRTLVVEYAVNAWKLYGWAMYCVPHWEGQLLFLASPSGKEDRPPRPTRYPIEFDGAAEALRSYQEMEFGLGGLANTDELAAVLFAARPAFGRVHIRRSIGRFDRETAMPVMEYSTRVYDRP